MTHIYKIVSQSEWRAAEAAGLFSGAAVDLADGFIHFSTAEQVEETAARYFAGQTDLLLVAVDFTEARRGAQMGGFARRRAVSRIFMRRFRSRRLRASIRCP